MKNSKLLYFTALLAISPPFIKLAAGANTQVVVKLSEIVSDGLDEYLIATGVLAYKSETYLDSQIVSTVTKVLVEAGARVKKGEVLLKLDSFDLDNQSDVLQQGFNSYKVEYAIAESELRAVQRKLNATFVKKQRLGKGKRDLCKEALVSAQLTVKHVATLMA